LIYLQPAAQVAFLGRLHEQVPTLDLLFLGATESLIGITHRFTTVRVHTAYAYRPSRRQEPQAPAPPAARAPARPPRDAGAYLAEGRTAMAAGRTAAAVTAFRRACYLDADDPVARLSLALALEAAGHQEAPRAFAAARAALERRSTSLDE